MEQDNTLKNKAIGGVLWKGAERVLAQIVTAIVSIVLARILMPDDYSVVSVVAIFFAFCNILISGGLNTALIQKKEADIIDFNTILISNIVIASLMYVALFFSAPFISTLFNKELITPVIRVLGLTFFINAYKSVISAKITSDLEFKKFFWSTIIGTIISAVVGVTMALNGFGPWALVAQQMVNSFVDSLVLTFTAKYKFKIVFSWDRFKKLFKYGGKIWLTSIISVTYDQTKPLIVGIKYSTIDLAYYNKGKTYPNLFASISNDTLASSLFPTMAKVQDDKQRILSMTRRFMQLSSFLVFPIMIGFLVLADNFVRIVLTEKWLPIVPYLMIFCVSDMFKPIHSGNLQAIRAIGRSDIILTLEIIKKILFVGIIVLFVFLTDGPIWIATSGIITSILASVINAFPNRKLIGYRFRDQLIDLFPNLIVAALMGTAVYFMKHIPINYYLLTALQIVTGVLLYFVLNLIIRNKNLFYFISTVKNFFGAKHKNVENKENS